MKSIPSVNCSTSLAVKHRQAINFLFTGSLKVRVGSINNKRQIPLIDCLVPFVFCGLVVPVELLTPVMIITIGTFTQSGIERYTNVRI